MLDGILFGSKFRYSIVVFTAESGVKREGSGLLVSRSLATRAIEANKDCERPTGCEKSVAQPQPALQDRLVLNKAVFFRTSLYIANVCFSQNCEVFSLTVSVFLHF